MAIQFVCPTCQHAFKTAEKNAGRTATCPACKNKVTIPGGAAVTLQVVQQPMVPRTASTTEQEFNPFASPQTGPEDYDPGMISTVPPMLEVRQGVTWLYAGMFAKILLGVATAAATIVMVAQAGNANAFIEDTRLKAISLVSAGILYSILIFGAYKLHAARAPISGKSYAHFAVASFFAAIALGIAGFAMGPLISITVYTGVLNIGAYYLGWLFVALHLKSVAEYAGLYRLTTSARNVGWLAGVNALLQPGMMIFSYQFVQATQAQQAVPAAPMSPGWSAFMVVIGILGLAWFVMNAVLLHKMRKALGKPPSGTTSQRTLNIPRS